MWLKKRKLVNALLSSSILYVMTWSWPVQLRTGAPSRVISSFASATLPKLLRVDKEEIAVKSAMMTSHLAWLSWRQVSCDTSRLFWHLSSPSAAHRKEWRHPCSQFSLWSGGWLGVGEWLHKTLLNPLDHLVVHLAWQYSSRCFPKIRIGSHVFAALTERSVQGIIIIIIIIIIITIFNPR